MADMTVNEAIEIAHPTLVTIHTRGGINEAAIVLADEVKHLRAELDDERDSELRQGVVDALTTRNAELREELACCNAHVDRLLAVSERQATILEQAIIDQLPKLANGVPAVPGMQVWSVFLPPEHVGFRIVAVEYESCGLWLTVRDENGIESDGEDPADYTSVPKQTRSERPPQ